MLEERASNEVKRLRTNRLRNEIGVVFSCIQTALSSRVLSDFQLIKTSPIVWCGCAIDTR